MEEANKEREEKDKISEMEKDTPAEVKCEGPDGRNNEGEVGKDEKMDTSSPTQEKKGAYMSELSRW